MLKKTITYTDFDGNKRTEDFYFNLTKSEVAEWELSQEGGMTALLERIIQQQDTKKTIETFKEIILKAYGEKSLDGKYFTKTQEIRDRFASTMAFDELFMSLATDDIEAINFINGIMPTEEKVNIEDARNVLGLTGGNNAGNNSTGLGTV